MLLYLVLQLTPIIPQAYLAKVQNRQPVKYQQKQTKETDQKVLQEYIEINI